MFEITSDRKPNKVKNNTNIHTMHFYSVWIKFESSAWIIIHISYLTTDRGV